jgi:hypothetical protein
METSDPRPKTSEEVDLTVFFKWVGRGFDRVGIALLTLMAGFRSLFFNNLLFFSIIISIGLLIGVVYSTTLQKTYYRSTMIINCAYLNAEILKNTIEKLNVLSSDPNKLGLSKELELPDSIANKIVEFEFKSFVSENDVIEMEILKEQLNNVADDKKELVEKIMKRLSIENKDAYEISVTVLRPYIVKDLQAAIINYFLKNDYINRRIEITKKMRLNRKEKLVQESRKLDSLKRVIFDNLESLAKSNRGSNNVILNDEVNNPLDIFREDLRINNEIQALEIDLYLQPDFELIDGLTSLNKPASAGLLTILVVSFGLSFVAGYLILLAFKLDRILANYPVKRQM